MKQLLESVKLVWARIPKKSLVSFILSVVGYFGKLALDLLIKKEEPFSFRQHLLPAFTGSAILLALYFSGSFAFLSLKIIAELRVRRAPIPAGAFDRLNARFDALTAVMKQVEFIPLTFERDDESRRKLVSKLNRILGIRIEMIATLDPEIVAFVDTRLRPLSNPDSGELSTNQAAQLAEVARDLQVLVHRVESKLLAEQEKLTTV